MSTNSRIFFTQHQETQTDGKNYEPVPMVMVPFDLYEAMAKVFYSGSSQPSSTSTIAATATTTTLVPIIQQTTGCPHTVNPTANIVNSDIEVVTEIMTAKPANSTTGHRDLNDLEKETNELGSSSKSSTVVSEKDTKNQTKKKISYDTYIERRKEIEKAQQNKPVVKKHPILTAHLTDTRKTVVGQTDPIDHNVGSLRSLPESASSSKLPNNSIKRSSNSDNVQQTKRKRVLSDTIREVFQAMARDMEAEASVDLEDDIPDGDAIKSWCITKASKILDKYRNKRSPIQGHSNSKSKH